MAVRRLELFHRYLTLRTNGLSERQLMLILAFVVGLVVGLATLLFEVLLKAIQSGLTSWFRVDSYSLFYLVYPVIGIILATLFVKYIVRDRINEGVTRVLYAISRNRSRLKPHNCYSSMVSSATTIGFGGSVGPEAPIVMTGSAIGSNIAAFMRLNYRNTTLLLCCGAAAAIAAIFKAPVAGVAFVLEILMLDITSASVIPILIAAVTGTSVLFFTTGFDPKFDVIVQEFFLLRNIPLYVLLGVLCGLISYYFIQTNEWVMRQFARIKTVGVKWLVGGLIIGVLVFFFPPLFAEGYDTLESLFQGDVTALFDNSPFYAYRDEVWIVIVYLLAILFFKVIAMSSTNAAGGVGGSFAPSLFVGAVAGTATALIGNAAFDLHLPVVSFMLVGMAGVMTGVMKAPLTAIFLIAELTGGYRLFVPLMLVAAISYAISYYFDRESIYTRKLSKAGDLMTHNKDQAVLLFLDMKSLIETDFIPLYENATLEDVVKEFSRSRRNVFPVVDFDQKLRGYVTLDDVRRDMFNTAKYDEPISDYLQIPPAEIRQDETMESVLAKFERTGAWNLPVVDEQKRYLGFVSKSKIFSAYREQLRELSYGD
ncbi:MAG: chloride channel protein [Rikenellaceae bacterium]|jgi:CIC family chloride channel protein|nr:chloride channel protein [Rikenellaceae bacterium]